MKFYAEEFGIEETEGYKIYKLGLIHTDGRQETADHILFPCDEPRTKGKLFFWTNGTEMLAHVRYLHSLIEGGNK